jgi:hypothetical protein
MEKRITKKVEAHALAFKEDIRRWLATNGVRMMGSAGVDLTSDFLQFVYDHSNVSLEKEDFTKRKRLKNLVPAYERCTAKRANGEQCTRRKREGDNFCGTHVKGAPHGVIQSDEPAAPAMKVVEVTLQDIRGIQYYIDEAHNVYHPGDIISSAPAPRKIATWQLNEKGEYVIPELGITA